MTLPHSPHSTPPDPATLRPFLDPLDRVKGELPGAALGWVRDLRDEGRQRFAVLGLPTQKLETWKYTPLKALAGRHFHPTSPTTAQAHFDVLPSVCAHGRCLARLVFVDGRLNTAFSTAADDLPAGVELLSLANALATQGELVGEHLGRLADADTQALVALNTAFLADGPVVRLARGAEIAEPIELVFVSVGAPQDTTVFHPRTVIIVEAGAKATLVEHHVSLGQGATWANHVGEIHIAEGAHLAHIKIQREGGEALHVAHTAVHIARDASYDSFVLNAGAALARNELAVTLAGKGGTARLDGAYMARGRQHVDNTTRIEHAASHCTSREVYKGVVDDQARAVFQGRILVAKGAERTDGHQLNRALLLSPTAEIDAKPELEIHADDVKCSHGATVGELDDDALFYLRARGIDLETARGLLIEAFLAETIDTIAHEAPREALRAVIGGWLAAKTR